MRIAIYAFMVTAAVLGTVRANVDTQTFQTIGAVLITGEFHGR